MPKNIVFCADGTWNGPSEITGVSVTDAEDTAGEVQTTVGNVTNVFKLFSNLPGDITIETLGSRVEQERVASDDAGTSLQVAKYLHGVGDSTNPIIKLLGGAFGVGIIARIVRGYTFVSRNYLPGDAIYIVGFSRGAYTARALAGMICKVGLLNPLTYDVNDKERAYQLGIAAWVMWRGMALGGGGQPISPLATALLTLVDHFAAADIPQNGLLPNVPVKAVGVWDTVGSLGIPLYAGGARLDVFRFADTALNPLVENGFHAMALHEQRADFPVTAWDTRNGIIQEWFVGAHADVGGGYPASESMLSNLALGWMLRRLADFGMRLNNPLPYPPFPQDPNQPIHTPWDTPPFNLLPTAQRQVDRANDKFHASVASRNPLDLPPGPPPLSPQQVANLSLDSTGYQGTAGT
jgi:hypothetical protein